MLLSSPSKNDGEPTAQPSQPPTNVPTSAQPVVSIQSPAGPTTIALGGTIAIQFTVTCAQGITRVRPLKGGAVAWEQMAHSTGI